MTLQLNKKLDATCELTYLGKEVALTHKEQKSFELVIGEAVHGFVNIFVKAAQLFNRIRKGFNQMRYAREEKNDNQRENGCNCLYDYKNMTALWEDVYIRRNFR